MKSSNIGGQAVLEGVMMKNGDQYAVAVRKPDGEIALQKEVYDGIVKWKKLTKIPFVRGIFSFVDSLVLGMKTLSYSASFFEEEAGEFDYGDHNGMFGSDRGCNLYGSSLLAVKSFETVCAGQICQDCYRGNREDCSVYRIYPADLEDEGYSARVHVSWSRT